MNASNKESIESLIVKSHLDDSIVLRDDVRSWVVREKDRGNRRAVQIGIAGMIGAVVLLLGWSLILNSEVRRVRALVNKSPSKSVHDFSEMTIEWCGEEPADFFVRRLTVRKTADVIASSLMVVE